MGHLFPFAKYIFVPITTVLRLLRLRSHYHEEHVQGDFIRFIE